jgi:hypothetical protein
MENTEMNMGAMMKVCMKKCRWCPLMPMTFGAVLFLLGFYLDAEVVKLLWLIFTGFMVLMGTFMLIMINTFFK